ncbi:hypothetical protein BJX96DRAFT_123845 [Aspergillus floccosus]
MAKDLQQQQPVTHHLTLLMTIMASFIPLLDRIYHPFRIFWVATSRHDPRLRAS